MKNEMSASALNAGESIDSVGHVAIVASVGLQLEKHRQRSRGLAGFVERDPEVVHQRASFFGTRRRRFGRAFEPFERLGAVAAIAQQTPE